MGRVLIACEESQTVCKAFRELGHEAYSCDIQECSGGHPEWHFQQDVFEVIENNGPWDLIIAHPPCTYLSCAGAVHLYRGGKINEDRLKKLYQAREFFMKIWRTKCRYLAIENPLPLKIAELPNHTQIIQPWQFGHGFTKKTLLWLHNLPSLDYTEIVNGRVKFVSRKGTKASEGSVSSKKERSKTFPGIARAMAEQWGKLI